MAIERLAPGEPILQGAPLLVTAQRVRDYLAAVGNTHPMYQEGMAIPPETLATRAIREMLARLSLPSGAVHIAQEMESLAPCAPGDHLVVDAEVVLNATRGEWRLLAVAFAVHTVAGEVALRGKSTVMIPTRETGGP